MRRLEELRGDQIVTDANEGPSDEPVESDVPPAVDDPGEPSRWKKFAIGAGALIVTVGGTIVATLAATKKSAIGENAKAYANGLLDGYNGAYDEAAAEFPDIYAPDEPYDPWDDE
jgi:hypothetical protein